MRSVSSNPPTPPDQALAQPLGQSLLVERENRVNPGGSQRWDQARDYGNHNEEQRCSRYAYGVRWTDMVQQRRDLWGRRKGDDEPGRDPRQC